VADYDEYERKRLERVADRLTKEIIARPSVIATDDHLKAGCFDCLWIYAGPGAREAIASHRAACPKHETWIMESLPV
jgi:hypothetical protein